ncbi:MAG: TetR/AcrR family transcriptional regulator, partial [Oscillospiraceae bacterium]
PPKHLKDSIKSLRTQFDDFNLNQYKQTIKNVDLREDITTDEALEYFFVFGEMFNGYFGSKAYENSDFNSLIKDHEMKLSKILNIMLYGITKEKKDNDIVNS